MNGNVINADVDTYAANLQTVYATPFPDGPLDPSRLSIASDLLLGQKTNIASLDQIKNNLATVFADFSAIVADIQTTANQTMEDLLALEPALHAMAANAISRGVDQYISEFFYLLNTASNQTWDWVGEAGACRQLRDAYDSAVSSFCDNYADYQNASWLLLGHTCLFLLGWTTLSFIVYKGMPQHVDTETGEDDFEGVVGVRHSPKVRAVFIERKGSGVTSPVPSIAITSAETTEESLTDSSDGRHSEHGQHITKMTVTKEIRIRIVSCRRSARTARVVIVDVDDMSAACRKRSDSKSSGVHVEVPRRSSHSRVVPVMPAGGAASPEVTPDMWSAEPRPSSAASFVASGRSVTAKTPNVIRVETLDY
ncbi:hypothetical protein BaRGS_00019199 [Batillaria attramentaria]|uniref:Uncharacterized protein n=1 Tax=Batillaria attramentaria TaxID=370345 RepID=A0ABD0KS29_9CAEN